MPKKEGGNPFRAAHTHSWYVFVMLNVVIVVVVLLYWCRKLFTPTHILYEFNLSDIMLKLSRCGSSRCIMYEERPTNLSSDSTLV